LSRNNSVVTAGFCQIDLSGTKGGDDLARQRLHVYLQANASAVAGSTLEMGSCMRSTSVHNCSSPKGVVSEDHLAVAMCSLAIVLVLPVAIASVPARSLFCGRRLADAEMTNVSMRVNTVDATPMSRIAAPFFICPCGRRIPRLHAPGNRV